MNKPTPNDKREVITIPPNFYSSSRVFSTSKGGQAQRVCCFALEAYYEQTGTRVIAWQVSIEHWRIDRWSSTRSKAALKEYHEGDWLAAFTDYCKRCAGSGLDAGFIIE